MDRSLLFWEYRWTDRFHPVRWSVSAALTRTRLPQIVSLVPIVGYALLYGDQLQSTIMRFGVLGDGLWFAPIQRLNLIYLGGLIVLSGLILFWAACPAQLKAFATRQSYIQAVRDAADEHEVTKAVVRLNKLLLPHLQTQDDHPLGPLYGEFRTKLVMISLANLQIDIVNQLQGPLIGYLLSPYHELLNRSRSFLAGVTLLLLVAGAVMFLLPSFEVTLMIARQFIH